MKKKLNKKNIYKNKNSKLDFTKYVKNKITYEFRNKVEDDRWLIGQVLILPQIPRNEERCKCLVGIMTVVVFKLYEASLLNTRHK